MARRTTPSLPVGAQTTPLVGVAGCSQRISGGPRALFDPARAPWLFWPTPAQSKPGQGPLFPPAAPVRACLQDFSLGPGVSLNFQAPTTVRPETQKAPGIYKTAAPCLARGRANWPPTCGSGVLFSAVNLSTAGSRSLPANRPKGSGNLSSLRFQGAQLMAPSPASFHFQAFACVSMASSPGRLPAFPAGGSCHGLHPVLIGSIEPTLEPVDDGKPPAPFEIPQPSSCSGEESGIPSAPRPDQTWPGGENLCTYYLARPASCFLPEGGDIAGCPAPERASS